MTAVISGSDNFKKRKTAMALTFGSDQTTGREAVWYGMPYLVVMDLVCLPRAETKGGYQGQEDQGQKGDTVPHLVCF